MKRGYPIILSTVGEHIRKKRMDIGLHQSDVGRMLKVSKDCVTNWENGRNEPQIKHYPSIITFLGYNPVAVDESTWAGKIFVYRCENGLSQKKLAKMLGVDPTTVKAWERGRRNSDRTIMLRSTELMQ